MSSCIYTHSTDAEVSLRSTLEVPKKISSSSSSSKKKKKGTEPKGATKATKDKARKERQ